MWALKLVGHTSRLLQFHIYPTSFPTIALFFADLEYILSQDGLLSQGNRDLIMRIYNKIPKISPDGKRLQVRYTHSVFKESKFASTKLGLKFGALYRTPYPKKLTHQIQML
jgi:hypothetical protein